MAVSAPSFIQKNRFGTFYFRHILPNNFTGYADKRIEIRRSLKTNLRSVAIDRARQLLVSVQALISEYEMKQQSEDNPIEWLRKELDTLVSTNELERKQKQDFFARLIEEAQKRLGERIESEEKLNGTSKKRGPRLSGLSATRISDAINSYCKENRIHWRPKTEFENKFLLNLIVEVLGDRKIGSLTLEDMRRYKEVVLQLPKNRSKMPHYREKSATEIIELDIPENERMGARSALKYLSRAKTFLMWARLNGFMTTEVGSVLTFKLPEREKKRRLPFSQKELRRLIKSEEYKKGKHRYPHHFWLPLLGMFTGARLNELCQLHTSDIRRLNNIWVISIRDGADRKVKNDQSIRDVPIHSKLQDLGFLKYVFSLKQKGEERIFPQLKPHRDGYGGTASKWFCEYQERCGVVPLDPKRELKGFHSFRHTVSTVLANSTAPGLYERVINQLLGHEKGSSESMQTYTHTISVKALKDAVEHIKYHVDFSHLQNERLNPYIKV